jgi:hypothetical protein
MPISLDDQARLPPLTPYDEVAERQRLADMKAFRQYLVETGAAKCLVKLYQHIAKNEMRLDNATILKEFLANHVEVTAETQECDRLLEENASLSERRDQLQQQADALAKELAEQQRLSVGKMLHQYLVSAEFWEGELDEEAHAAGLPVNLLYRRLCGQKVDKATRQVLVDTLRPATFENLRESARIPPEELSEFIATGIPELLHDWCRNDLLPRFSSVPVPQEPPYERELLQAIRNSGLYPDRLEEVRFNVDLDSDLLHFLSVLIERFG